MSTFKRLGISVSKVLSLISQNARLLTSQKNSIEDDGGDLQLVGDQSAPASDSYYGTNSVGQKGFFPVPPSGDNVFVNEVKMYKAFSDVTPGINNGTSFQTLFFKTPTAGTYDNTVFAPVANGVQLLKDLVSVRIRGGVYVVSNAGQRISVGTSVAINGVPSTVEGGGYIRGVSGHNEESFTAMESFTSLPAGTVITIQGRRLAGASNQTSAIADKEVLVVEGFIPDSPGVMINTPTPIVTTITTTP